jgi:hypothetical protein
MDIGTEGSPKTSSVSTPANICGTALLSNNQYTGDVVVSKLGTWPHDSAAMALTSFCTFPNTPFNKIYTAVIEINYQNFFTSGSRLPDLQTIILHEFGHLVGLGHSCELGSAGTGLVKCSASIDAKYIEAVMFPSFSFPDNVHGEKRQDLKDNDMGRANCLYPELAPKT